MARLHKVPRRRVCLSNNAAERGLRGIALGRKSWLFAGSDIGVSEAGCPAFTESGIECLKHIIIEERALLARKLDPNR